MGAGFAGLGTAIQLDKHGFSDFLVVDRGSSVGGTWRDNTYPGAACDVPSQLYSFSFVRNPDWSSSYSPQPEIQAYLKKVAQRSGTLDRFVFDTTVDHYKKVRKLLVYRDRDHRTVTTFPAHATPNSPDANVRLRAAA